MSDFMTFDYNYVSKQAVATGQRLIDFFDLHRHPEETINIGPLLEKFDVRFLDLPETTWGFTLDIQHKIIIAINEQLDTELTRYVVMHEVGHVACWHPNQLHNCLQGQWLYDQLETEATTVAAYLLIPRLAVADPARSTMEEIATQYRVPSEVALIRRMLFQQTGC